MHKLSKSQLEKRKKRRRRNKPKKMAIRCFCKQLVQNYNAKAA